ncbi:hypothetical protein [Vibrio mediterranei]|nr:hypothetical protein [Vibrio mediterranei]
MILIVSGVLVVMAEDKESALNQGVTEQEFEEACKEQSLPQASA